MRKITALLAAGLVLGMGGQAMAVNDATATASTQAVVVKPITLASFCPIMACLESNGMPSQAF